MHARRDRVAEAAENTFAWLIEDEFTPEELSTGLEISLRQWLRTGTNVFHVTGKPGSGKSTFMKFIDKSKEVDVQLRQRADEDHKDLIRASCYLWKAVEVNALQNELEGRARTLLFQILQGKPELTGVVFENRQSWDPTRFTLVNCVTNSHSTAVTLGPEEILATLESALTMSDHYFFLLIDGLDEMKTTREHGHKEIAERILHWSTHNFGHVKICVSSREDRAFIETFPGRQRLQLHAVTSEDVKALVYRILKDYGHLTSDELEVLAVTITKQAKGVFLWVVLAIHNLTPLLTAKQGNQRLMHQVRTVPEEMNGFLAETLRRIPECYRKEAWAVFTVRASIDPRISVPAYSLIHFSMLEKCLDGSGWRIDEHEDLMGAEGIAHQLRDFASRFSGLSLGLLELSAQHPWYNRPIFTHRSVYDFLQDHPDKLSKALAIPRELQRLSAPELIIRSTILVVTGLSLEELSRDPFGFYGTDAFWTNLHFMTLTDGNTISPLLKILEEVLFRKQRTILGHRQFNETKWTDLHLHPHAVSVFHRVLTKTYRPYFDWAQENRNYPSWIIIKEFKVWTVERVFHCACFSEGKENCGLRPYEARYLFENIQSFRVLGWLSYDSLIETDHSLKPKFSPVLRGSLWLHLFLALLV